MDAVAVRSPVLVMLRELVDGASQSGWILNPMDPGLLRSLDKLSAAEASAPGAAGSSIAAHVDHIRYGLELVNRWGRGEKPFDDADYSASWKRRTVGDAEWASLRQRLRDEAHRWMTTVEEIRDVSGADAPDILIASAAHLAYHLGAIRQMSPGIRGPREGDRAQG